MSDEEDETLSEAFSASEDEWKPGKQAHDDGESSDDDDSDFEDSPGAVSGTVSGAGIGTKTQSSSRKREPKSHSKNKTEGGGVAKKRKPMGQSLRARLYNKYRPPPKTCPITNSNSPTASTSRTASKNEQTPNEVSGYGDDDGSSSDCSVGNHLVNPAEIDLKSNFFNVENKGVAPAPPEFDCNAGIENLSDSESDQSNAMSGDDNSKPSNAFDFRNLLEKANSLERAKEQIAKRRSETNNKKSASKASKSNDSAVDVTTLLALGENQNMRNKLTKHHDMGAEEDDEDDDGDDDARTPSKLSKTKSTRIKRHTKTRPSSTIVTANAAGGDSDDSDWEEVADHVQQHLSSTAKENDLQILVEMPSRKRMTKEEKTKHELELAFRRKLNRDMKEQQMLMHKASLLCLFGRSYNYNRLLNDTLLMQAALKLLPGKRSYPRETGTELKYFQSFVTWFKTAIKLSSPNLYPEKGQVGKTRDDIREGLLAQMKKKEARCLQDMIFIFIILVRGMGLQCRLVVSMQPLPLKPAQENLLTIKLKPDNENESSKGNTKETTAKNKKNSKKSHSSEEKDKKNVHTKDTREAKITRKTESKDSNENKNVALKEKSKTEKTSHTITIRDFDKEAVKATTTKRSEKNIKDNKKEVEEKKKPSPEKLTLSQKLSRNAVKQHPESEQVEKEKKVAAAKEKSTSTRKKPTLSNLKRSTTARSAELYNSKKSKLEEQIDKDNISMKSNKSGAISSDSGIQLEISVDEDKHVLPQVLVEETKEPVGTAATTTICPTLQRMTRSRSRSISPRPLISSDFLQSSDHKKKFLIEPQDSKNINHRSRKNAKAEDKKIKVSLEFVKNELPPTQRVLRSRQNLTTTTKGATNGELNIPQLDGADDDVEIDKTRKKKRPQLEKLKKHSKSSDDDFQPSPSKQPKRAPVLPKAVEKIKSKDRHVLSTDNDTNSDSGSPSKSKIKKETAADIWVEVWSDVENEWICVDIVKGKLNSVEAIRRSASSNLAYVFAFQNDLSLKDVTARYNTHWSTVVRKSRVEKQWLETAISSYYGVRTERDIREDHEMRRIHEEKPLPTTISDLKDHPLYVLERHLLKFQAIYPPNPPTLGFTKTGDAIYSRDCVHVLHSRDIWLKQARTVKLGEQPYKIVKARPKWDRLSQTVIKDQPLEIFGYWQTQDYEPPTAENGIVPRNAYGNVELFKECMLPKKTVHIRLPGLNRICKKLGIDCANAVVGFDFHQGVCHPAFDGFVICEEFQDEVTAAWYQDQEDQERKEIEKYEARVYGNWKKLIRGLLIRERLKKKYNF